MKLNEIFDELLDLVKRSGYTVRKERGQFHSGYCVLNEEKIIIFNKSTTMETQSAVLARCLLNQNIDDMYIKPAVREFIEREKFFNSKADDFSLEVKF